MNAQQKRIAMVAEQAKKAFAEHQIEVRLNQGLFRNWQCSRPKSSVYLFNISTEPGRLFVTGDIGVLVVERVPDMIDFALRTIGDLHYFASKVPSEIKVKEFDPEVAVEWLKEHAEDDSITQKDFANLKAVAEDQGYEEFCRALYDSGTVKDCDFPKCENFTYGYLWQREAIKWLLERI